MEQLHHGSLVSIPARDPATRLVNVVVETPRGSRNKYKYDEALGIFRLHKLLPAGAAFPFDFCFVPCTRAEDGDPLDVALLVDEPGVVGSVVTVRLLGVLQAEQTEKRKTIRNDRLIAMAETAKIKPDAATLQDLPARLLRQIEHFFVSYNRFEGRTFKVIGRHGPRATAKLIDRGIANYRKARARSGGAG
jgi:inorganic pyrophosphatase